MRKILPKAFFDRPTEKVAKELIGKYLVRSVRGKEVALMIIETECYHGHHDKASHARHGKTARNAPMFGEAGVIYVYFTYGMHWMLNITCGKKDFPAAVLIRAAGDIIGPARLTKHLHIDKELNKLPLGKKSGFWVEDRGERINPRNIKRTPRIGIPNAGDWVDKKWRFVLEGDS